MQQVSCLILPFDWRMPAAIVTLVNVGCVSLESPEDGAAALSLRYTAAVKSLLTVMALLQQKP